MPEALEAVVALVERRQGGAVFTPNVDHLVLLEEDARLRDAYASASLSLADGQWIIWASHLLGTPLRDKVSGSDLIGPLLKLASEKRWRVYLLGGREGAAARVAERSRCDAPGAAIVGIDPRRIDVDRAEASHADLIASLEEARPDLVLVALGCPKQEILIHRIASAVQPAVCIGLGASLDFLAGVVPRAPRWIAGAGFEWLYRLAREPRRLWRRYLIRGPKLCFILLRELRSPPARRAPVAAPTSRRLSRRQDRLRRRDDVPDPRGSGG